MQMTAENIRAAMERAAQTRKRVEVSDDDCAGLELGISPHGVLTWSLRMRDPTGKLRRFGVGKFPEMTAAAARRAARAERARVEGGHDPIAEKRAKRLTGAAVRDGIGTLKAVIDQYEAQANPPKSWFSGAGRKRVERVFGELQAKAVATMRPSDIIRCADGYAGTRQSAQNAIRALRPVLSWAARRDYVPANLLAVTPGEGVPKRNRVLSVEEIRKVLLVLWASKSSHAAALFFIMLTLARREEAVGARWGEVDFAASTWTIPAARQKATKRKNGAEFRQALVVPLSRQAVNLLASLKPNGKEPERDFLIFDGRGGSKLGNWDRVQKRLFKETGTSGWHRHDLRRTGSTMMGDAGVLPHVVEAALNHATIHTDLAGRYNQSRYREDVKEALQTLANRYDMIGAQFVERPDEYGEMELVRVDSKTAMLPDKQ